MTTDRTVMQGERLVISHGEYSDYRVLCVVEAVESFSVDFALKEFATWRAGRAETQFNDEYTFLAWLMNVRSAVREVAVEWREWHLGEYAVGLGDTELSPWRDAMSIYNEDDYEMKHALAEVGSK